MGPSDHANNYVDPKGIAYGLQTETRECVRTGRGKCKRPWGMAVDTESYGV